jgi:hypothetical protein
MAYIRETGEFDQETLHILGNALDEAWRRVKSNHLNGRAYGARTVLAQHIFAMANSLWPNRTSGTLIVSSTVR